MGIIKQKSLGNIFYTLIDDVYPVYSGKTGEVAISTLGGVYICENAYIWSNLSSKNVSAEIYSYGNTDTTLAPTLDTWFNMNSVSVITPYSALTNNSGFTLTLPSSAPRLNIAEDNIGRFLLVSSNTLRATNTRWDQIRIAPARNNAAPIKYNVAHFGTSAQNDVTNIISPTMFTGSARNGDYFFQAYYVDSREANTAYLSRVNNKLTAQLIEQPIIFTETANSQLFTTNGWVTVNDTTNKWFMGTGTTFSGGGTSIYISNDSGATPSYDNGISQVSHFYKDFTFPKNLQSDVLIEFYWKSNGQAGVDYGKTYFAPTGVTPVAGTALATTYAVGSPFYQSVTSFSAQTINIHRDDAIDQTKRLIFSWVNDSSAGTSPPFTIDSFRLSYYVNDIAYTLTNGDTETFNFNGFSGNSWSLANGATNFWTIGVSEFSGSNDTYSAYITNANNTAYYGSEFHNFDNRALAQYTITTAQVSHFYRNVTLTSASTLTFNWKCWGENAAAATNYDYGAVVIAATGTTPVAGTEVSTTQAVAGGNGRIGATTNLGKFNLGYGGADNNWRTETINLGVYSGQTKRIIFTFKNDASAGNNPGFVVDNVKITGAGNWATRLEKIN